MTASAAEICSKAVAMRSMVAWLSVTPEILRRALRMAQGPLQRRAGTPRLDPRLGE